MNDLLQFLTEVLRIFESGDNPQTFLTLIGLSFARIISFFLVVPFFGALAVSLRVKIGVAAALVVIVYPALAGVVSENNNFPMFGTLGFVALLTKEVFVGFTLGFVAALVFEAARIAGKIVDYLRGATFRDFYAPPFEGQSFGLELFKLQFAVVIFLSIGAHYWFLNGLVESFVLIPATEFPRIEGGWSALAALITNLTGTILEIALQLAMPVIVALLLTDILIGVINRTTPHMAVFFLSLPLKMTVGLLIAAIALPFFQERLIFYFRETYAAFEYTLKYFVSTPPG